MHVWILTSSYWVCGYGMLEGGMKILGGCIWYCWNAPDEAVLVVKFICMQLFCSVQECR